jgi:hypothetical protein
MKRLLTIQLILFVSVFTSMLIAPFSYASTAGFNAGSIMSDAVMTNSSTMSVSLVQSFLNSKVSTCDTNGQQLSEFGGPDLNHDGKVQRWEWGKSKYNQTTFPCLKDYVQNGKKASQIIYDVAHKYSINPQVLIVLLQKEQGLVTDTWPLNIQYRSATGYGCPDTAPCDSQYYGLTNQLDWSAKMFRSIINQDPNWYSPYIRGSNPKVYWHPSGGNYVNTTGADDSRAGCGYNSLTISNWSTASLYSYTPYRPNQAALNAGYGTGDGCSSYGNRNFYSYFTDWFGTTAAPSYAAEQVTQSADPSLAPGSTVSVFIDFRNFGNQSWYDDSVASANGRHSVRLATANPINRSSAFSHSSWLSNNRPSGNFDTVFNANNTAYSTNPHIVKPGETGRFRFTLNVPAGYSAGSYREVFSLVEDGGSGQIRMSVYPWIDITVQRVVKAAFVTQSSYPSLRPGESTSASFITFKNTGNTTWYDDSTATKNNAKPVRLATMNPTNRTSIFAGGNWGTDGNRPSRSFTAVYNANGDAYSTNPHIVKPGESARFQFTTTNPDNNTPASYREYFGPIEEGGAGVIATTPVTPWLDISSTDADTAKAVVASDVISIARTNTLTRTYQFKNTGTKTWGSSIKLRVVDGSASGLRGQGWNSDEEAATLNEASVAPGDIGSFTVNYRATAQPGNYAFKLAPADGSTSISLQDTAVNATITKPSYVAKYVSESAFPTITQNDKAQVAFRFKNNGNVNWYDGVTASANQAPPIVLATTSPINRMSEFSASFKSANRPTVLFNHVFESDGVTVAANQHVALPGQIVEYRFDLTAPQTLKAGTYREYFQPIVEGESSWDMHQVVWTNVTVKSGVQKASYYGQSAYPTIQKGSSANAYLSFKNSGNTVWYDLTSVQAGIKPVTLAATNPINRTSVFNSSFATPNRPAVRFSVVYEADGTTLASDQHIVLPNQIARFNFQLTAPSSIQTGTYREYFQPILEGGQPWNLQQIAWLDVTVTN